MNARECHSHKMIFEVIKKINLIVKLKIKLKWNRKMN